MMGDVILMALWFVGAYRLGLASVCSQLAIDEYNMCEGKGYQDRLVCIQTPGCCYFPNANKGERCIVESRISKPRWRITNCSFPQIPPEETLIKDFKLIGEVDFLESVFTELQCADLCLRHRQCIAYNYGGKAKEDKKTCEVLSHIRSFQKSKDFSYRIFERREAEKFFLQPHTCV
ncbi:uncharacterized protein LOC116601976 [Nematostella vectensis]|uniref:uncharacterized protein LOC116601976 n=1 Tax=Nematostella vectensis TaxID=45351 RepID=UPI002077889B|nr:uncharacterized protein LOC116601976 [Nematostella vectensis]